MEENTDSWTRWVKRMKTLKNITQFYKYFLVDYLLFYEYKSWKLNDASLQNIIYECHIRNGKCFKSNSVSSYLIFLSNFISIYCRWVHSIRIFFILLKGIYFKVFNWIDYIFLNRDVGGEAFVKRTFITLWLWNFFQ